MRTIVIVGAIALCSGAVQAKVARTTLNELISTADVIVLGTDSSIEHIGRWDIAHLAVEEVLKGEAPQELLYLATPTWTCDIATAKVGQRVLLLLSRPDTKMNDRSSPPAIRDGQLVYQINWSGRGRLPIDDLDGEPFATIWTAEVQEP